MIKRTLLFISSLILLVFSFSCKGETEYVEVEKIVEKEVEKIVEVEKTDSTAPAAVTEIAATGGNNSVLLSWKNPEDADFYGTRISFTPAAENVIQPIIIEGKAGETSKALFNGLTNGTEYTFSLTALDKSQNAASAVTKAATPVSSADITPPAEVSDFTITNGNKAVLLSWKNPSDADFYAVEISSTPAVGTLANSVIICGDKAENMSFKVDGLENNTTYTLKLRTIDKTLNTSAGTQKTGTPAYDGDVTPPAEVSDFTVTSGNKTVFLSWKNPNESDFYAIEISCVTSEGTLAMPIILRGSADENMSFKVESLRNDISYSFKIQTLDDKLNISSGTISSATPAYDGDVTPPANVTNLQAINKGAAILLTWTDATDSDIFGYEITYSSNDTNTSNSSQYLITSQGQEYCHIRNLTNGTNYTFTVKSLDKSGNKSSGKTISATPAPSLLNIELSIPEELSNTTIPVTARITSSAEITKVVYKKNGSENPQTLLAEGTPITTLQTNNTWTFNADEKTYWTVASEDAEGRQQTARIYARTIDKVPPAEVTNIIALYNNDNNTVGITWVDPENSTEDYNSPFTHILVTYTLNGGTEVYTARNTAQKGTQTLTVDEIDSSADYYTFTVHTVDELGNVSTGRNRKVQIANVIYATLANLQEKLSNITQTCTVVISGECTSTQEITDAFNSITASYTAIDLDLTSVTGLTNPSFRNCNRLRSILLPNTVTTIGYEAFYGCEVLNSVYLPDNLISIGNRAFMNCSKLNSMTLGKKLESIGYQGLLYCKMDTLQFPKTLKTIAPDAFSSCLKSVIFEDTDSVWYYTENSNFTNGISIGSMSSTNYAENATKIVSTYRQYYLYNDKYTAQ